MIPQTTELSQIQAAFIDKDNRIEELMRQINSAQSLLNSLKDTMNSLVGDGKITIQTYTGSNVGDFTVNQKEDKTITLPQQTTVNNGTLTIQKNGTSVGTFTANQSGNTTANISVPTKTSEITNDSGFITSSDLPVVNDGTLTIQKNGTQVATFTANQSGNVNANITVPTATSELTNDSNYISDVNYVHTDNNFTSADKTKLDGIESGAEVNVQSNWNEINAAADSYIRNKPTLALVATSGSYTDLSNQPTIPAAQVNSDWNASSGVARILNKPTIPTAVSQLTNDSGYLTASTLPSMRFTYIVDNDTKLQKWANESRSGTLSEDYTSVLVKGNISGSNLFFNLTKSKTKIIKAEPDSKLALTYNSSNVSSETNKWVFYYESTNNYTSLDDLIDLSYIISDLNIEINYIGSTANIPLRLFWHVPYITNIYIKATNTNTNTSNFYAVGLSRISNSTIDLVADSISGINGIDVLCIIYNCNIRLTKSTTTNGDCVCCRNNDIVRNLTIYIQPHSNTENNNYGIKDSRGVSYCRVISLANFSGGFTAYYNSYFSTTANATYACANTLNGGWNT